jgi:AP-2 complex subunit alpha
MGAAQCAVKTQAKLLLIIEVTTPIDDAPAMRVCFETADGECHEYPLRLLSSCHVFRGTSYARTGPSCNGGRVSKEMSRVSSSSQDAARFPSIDEEYMERVAAIVTDGLKFGRCTGCDPLPGRYQEPLLSVPAPRI